MRITLNIFNPQAGDQDTLVTLDVFPDMTLSTLRESVHADTAVAPSSQHIYHNGRLITDDTKTMEELQITDGDMLAVHVREMRSGTGAGAASTSSNTQTQAPQPAQQPIQRGRPGATDPELIRLQILGDPELRQQVERQNAELASALDDPARFAQLFSAAQDRDSRERLERQREIERLNEDPFNVENQRKIEDMIRQERVMENLQNAMEHTPEVFGRVQLLYINVEVNGHKVKGLVDSGAQATIMSPAYAEACGIMRLIDKRYAGVAHGVGTARILGRVHSAQIKVGNLFLPCSFTVMEGKTTNLLLGLDMLKRFQATIDLSANMLKIQGQEVPFLGEADIPKDEEPIEQEKTISGPSGMTIGQETGAVLPPGVASHPPQERAQAVAQPTTTSNPAQGAAPPAPTPNITPAHVEQLIAMGATREQAEQALRAADDNLEVAAGAIFF